MMASDSVRLEFAGLTGIGGSTSVSNKLNAHGNLL